MDTEPSGGRGWIASKPIRQTFLRFVLFCIVLGEFFTTKDDCSRKIHSSVMDGTDLPSQTVYSTRDKGRKVSIAECSILHEKPAR